MDSSPVRVLGVNNTVAGVKRSAPGPLLPPFEPFSSPPSPKRRKSRVPSNEHENRYPTPVPSSSLGIFSSPPLHVSARKPLLARSQSALSERAPLSALPSITLPDNGEPVLLGRSSNSSHYQLSANRLISRVHVKAQYLTTASRPKIEIQCMGWNGVKIHCQGRAWELCKGDVFTSETENAEIMLDVQDSRVVLAWPTRVRRSRSSSTSTIDTPTRTRVSRSPSVGWVDDNDENVDPRCSNGRTGRRLFNVSTEKRHRSPPPRRGLGNSSMFQSDPQMTDTFLEIYEDEPVADFNEEDHPELPLPSEKEEISEAAMKMLLAAGDDTDDDEELNQLLLEDEDEDEEEEEEEEEKGGVDALSLSFAPEPILPPMVTFSTAEPLCVPGTPPTSCTARAASIFSSPIRQSRSASISPNKATTVQNHIVNQLAFSRLSSTPLFVLFSNLPSLLGASVTKERLVQILESIDCIGEIKRQGKDAAGKPLQSEYYYIPDNDNDAGRRAAVVDGMGRVGLRSCRKSHKQYYWKKPKKPTY